MASETQKIKESIKRAISGKGREFRAILGRADGTVKASGRNVYVTLYNGDVIEVYNARVPLRTFRKIWVGYDRPDSTLLQVLRFDHVYADQQDQSVYNHHETHAWYGYDATEIYREQFVHLLPRAAGGLLVRVHAGHYIANSIRHFWPTQDIDMTAEAVAAGAEWVNAEADEFGAVTFTHGTNKATRSLLVDEDIPALDDTKYWLFSVKMYSGLTDFIQVADDTDIYDPRFTGYAPGGGGSGTPAGSDTEIQFNNAGAFGADITFKRNSDGSITIGPYNTGLPLSAYGIHQASEGTSVDHIMQTFGDTAALASFLTFVRAGGTSGSPTQTLLDYVMGRIRWRAHDGGGFGGSSSAEINVEASEDHTITDHGTVMNFFVTPNGSTTPLSVLVMDPTAEMTSVEGHEVINAANPTDPQSLATRAFVDKITARSWFGI